LSCASTPALFSSRNCTTSLNPALDRARMPRCVSSQVNEAKEKREREEV
jgi:hypothetical protein